MRRHPVAIARIGVMPPADNGPRPSIPSVRRRHTWQRVETAVSRGLYIDPHDGRIRFGAYAIPRVGDPDAQRAANQVKLIVPKIRQYTANGVRVRVSKYRVRKRTAR